MLRSGLILGIAGPAALLTVLLQPMVRESADVVLRQDLTVVLPVQAVLVAKAAAETRVAAVVRSERRPAERSMDSQGHGRDKSLSKLPRRLMKEGCEGAISSLAGPEARRMLPGRCIA